MKRILLALVMIALNISLAASPAALAVDLSGIPVFEAPGATERLRRAEALIAARRSAEALALTDAVIADYPTAGLAHALRAAALVSLERHPEAIEALEQSAASGFGNLPLMLAQPVFAPVRDDPRVTAMGRTIVPARPVDPLAVTDHNATMAEGNTRWDLDTRMFRVSYVFPPVPSRDRGPITAATASGAGFDSLVALRRRAAAAGHVGDLYDNRDNGHSWFDTAVFPQLGRVTYAPEAQRAGMNRNINDRIVFGATVVGNASLALTSGTLERSLPRLAMTQPGMPARLAIQYLSNNIYVYPSHRDYGSEMGDRFPAVLPYLVVSQGSSGTDRPLVRALLLALGAFRSDTKAVLRDAGLIAPTLQMLLRQARVPDRDAYMQPDAHPSALVGSSVDLDRIVMLANALLPDAVPPSVQVKVVAEPQWESGIDLFGDGLSERLFDGPASVARIARASGHSRRYVLDAGATVDPNDRPLRFHWRIMRGDTSRISIVPQTADGRRVEITIPWHERGTVPGRPDLSSDRVEIAVFADNGINLSAPGFFTVYFPTRQSRTYADDGRILSLAYAATDRRHRYEDPSLIPLRDWRDDYHYDSNGALLGWTRHRAGGESRFTRHGARVVETDTRGRPIRALKVAYPVTNRGDGQLLVAEEPTGTELIYAYDGADDLFGYLDAVPVSVSAP